MNTHSLSTKITFIFTVSTILVCILFMLLYRFQTDRNLGLMEKRQFQSMNYLLQLYANNTPPKNIEAYFNFFGLLVVQNQNLATSVLQKGEVNFSKITPIGQFSSLLYNDRYYLFIKSHLKQILLESQDGKNSSEHLWIGFFLALGVLITTYVSIMNSFKPLQHLSKNIRKFASGDLNTEYKSNQQDEIAEVANEFNNAVKKIRHLILSRQLFLRTIMHELKTPIGKGRIVAEMLEDELPKKRLINVFERLDLLLNEFSKIEQLVSKSYQLNIKEYPLSSILEQAYDILLLDEKQLDNKIISKLNNEDICIKADFELFSLAIKNLLDNAIKHSSDKKVIIQNIKNGIRFANHGTPLEYSIEHYLTAFIRNKNSSGMGLGLYIIKNILEHHEFNLNYSYQNDLHCFDIIWDNTCENKK